MPSTDHVQSLGIAIPVPSQPCSYTKVQAIANNCPMCITARRPQTCTSYNKYQFRSPHKLASITTNIQREPIDYSRHTRSFLRLATSSPSLLPSDVISISRFLLQSFHFLSQSPRKHLLTLHTTNTISFCEFTYNHRDGILGL